MFDPGRRLAAAAQLVRGGGSIADIGTDHAYLPAFLILTGKCTRALACDIGKGPLLSAERALRRLGLTEKIGLRLSDGLAEVSPEEADEIAVCGMGGTLIARILSDAPWIRRLGMRLILQPMTHAEDVRGYLAANGFRVTDETVTAQGKRLYLCMAADYDGVIRELSPAVYYFGTLAPDRPENIRYLEKQAARLRKQAEGLRLTGSDPEALALIGRALACAGYLE